MQDPCTQGVDVSRAVMPLKEFASIGGASAPSTLGVSNAKVRVMFADVEGQGDRDVAYDARLASAILPLTKCVLFNWRDSLQVDRILNLLGVMQRAAHNIDLGDEGDESTGPKFGHLHVIFRDWNYSGTPEEVRKQLFGLDNKGIGAEVAIKNELRRTIQAAFASITVWLFPAPVEMTKELSRELSASDLSPGFRTQLASLRTSLSTQLSEPTSFGRADPVTGHALGAMVPALVDVLNRGEIIMPQSAYQQMLALEAEALKKSYMGKIDNLHAVARRACDNGPPIAPAQLESDMAVEIESLIAMFTGEAKKIGCEENIVSAGGQELRSRLEAGMEGLRAYNRTALNRHTKAAAKRAREVFTREFSEEVKALMPLSVEELSSLASAATSKARAIVQAVPSAGEGDDSIEDALSSLGDFVELAANKAKLENTSMMAQKNKLDEEAFDSCVRSLESELNTVATNFFSTGKPFKLEQLEKAGKAATSQASARLEEKLSMRGVAGRTSNNSGSFPNHLTSFVGRLEDAAASKMNELRSRYKTANAAAMHELAIEGGNQLRAEIVRDLHPQLPMEAENLKLAFKPVLRRVQTRIDAAAEGWTLTMEEKSRAKDSLKSHAESLWQALAERNNSAILLEEKNAAEAKAERLRGHVEEERRRVQEVESSAREAAMAAARARQAVAAANEQLEQEQDARKREAAAHEKEKREAEARREEERERLLLEKAAAAKSAADAAKKAKEEEMKRHMAEQEAAAKREAEEGEGNVEDEADKFEDAMDAEENGEIHGSDEEPKDEEGKAREARTRRSKRARREQEEVEGGSEDDGDAVEPPTKRRSNRRRTLVTPVGKDPAALKKAREEANQKRRECEEKAVRLARESGEEESEPDDEEAGLTAVEKSRLRAKRWAEEQKAKKKKDASAAKSGGKTSSRAKSVHAGRK